MCGIVAYVGKNLCREYILQGLSRLEYRGYDSAGYVCIDNKYNQFRYEKDAFFVEDLRQSVEKLDFDGHVGIGHTRWATHGIANKSNAHPHFNCQKTMAVVHNGIIEDYQAIREKLINSGHNFVSNTDTEVIVHLFSSIFEYHKDLNKSLVSLVNQLKGAYAFVLLMQDNPDKLILVRRKSPLAVGIGDNEIFAASDPLAFIDRTNKVIFVPDDSFAILSPGQVDFYDFMGNSIKIEPQYLNFKIDSVDKQGFEHFMLKEIYEQKKAIDNTVSFCKSLVDTNNICQQLGLSLEQINNIKKINLIAAGTSWHACRIGQFFIENICKIPVHVYLASEFRYMPFFPDKESVYIFVSQSGETADTLEALRLVNTFNLKSIAITNVSSSTMVRESSGFLPMQAGPEISVASTKAFSTQLATLYWLANKIALYKKLITDKQMHQAEQDLFIAAEVLETSIETYKWQIIQELAKKYSKFDRFIFLGRHVSYPFAMEAALKLKEISYIFSQCYPAGELKHGPIALVDERTPVIMFSLLDDFIYQKLVSNAQEVKARKGHLVTFAFEGQDELINLSDLSFVIPRVNPLLAPLAMTGLMQFFVYQITKELGRPIDRPRNLAKSVTVE